MVFTSGVFPLARIYQVSMEFMLVFGLVLLASGIFLKVLNSKVSDFQDQEDFVLMQNLASVLRNEVLLATQVNNNYIRQFVIPPNLNGKNYSLALEKDILSINITGEKGKSVAVIFPAEIKGGFLEKNHPGFLNYCITKNSNDIRISRNLVSLELASVNGDYVVLSSSIKKKDTFTLYLRSDCVFNLQSVSFDLVYSPKVSFQGAKVPDTHLSAVANSINDPLSKWMGKAGYYTSSCSASSALRCNQMFIVKLGKGPLGSGVVLELEFKADQIGDSDIGVRNLEVIDNKIGPNSPGYIPPSSQGVKINIKS